MVFGVKVAVDVGPTAVSEGEGDALVEDTAMEEEAVVVDPIL